MLPGLPRPFLYPNLPHPTRGRDETIRTYVVDVSRATRRIEHLHIVTRVYVIRVIRQPERPIRIEAAVFRVETADARLNRENATCGPCGKPCVTSVYLFCITCTVSTHSVSNNVSVGCAKLCNKKSISCVCLHCIYIFVSFVKATSFVKVT